jgi:glycosyltransferase involved in cell wall biosynthesis
MEFYVELTIVMPCLNEAETVAICVRKAVRFIADSGISGEVVVADNGSADGSRELAADAGARVVPVAEKGYGSALMGGILSARGEYVIMGDADDSYDFTNLMPFVTELRKGADLVMGNRFKGGIAPGGGGEHRSSYPLPPSLPPPAAPLPGYPGALLHRPAVLPL